MVPRVQGVFILYATPLTPHKHLLLQHRSKGIGLAQGIRLRLQLGQLLTQSLQPGARAIAAATAARPGKLSLLIEHCSRV